MNLTIILSKTMYKTIVAAVLKITRTIFNYPLLLQQHNTDLTGRHRGALPVVQIELQETVAGAELELFESLRVLHQVQCVKHVRTCDCVFE